MNLFLNNIMTLKSGHNILIIFVIALMFSQNILAATYHISSVNGDDNANGLSANSAWKTIEKIQNTNLLPGDSVRFERGSSFETIYFIYDSGNSNAPIIITDYGNEELSAPSFTNKVFEQGNFGNCIRIKGSYVIVENLYFHDTPTYKGGSYTTDGGWAIWEMGTVYIDKGAEYCIVRNNEFNDCPVGIKSYGNYALITNNYVHDCNRVLAEWNWGPIGIWLGADNQEASYNRIFNMRAEDPRIKWAGDHGGGADGGAFEIDDGRYPKSNIHIHHNYTRDCQGFMEITWTDVVQHPEYKNFKIHHNISDDYQAFMAIWQGENFEIDHNTIVRRKVNSNDWGVFNITGNNIKNKIRNNIIVTEKDISIFNTGITFNTSPNNIIENNLYFAAEGRMNLGKEGPGKNLVQGNPQFVNYERLEFASDFAIKSNSPAINKAQNLAYNLDFNNNIIPDGNAYDIGAFEYFDQTSTHQLKSNNNFVYSYSNNIIINNSENFNQAYIYNSIGSLLKKINLKTGMNKIEMNKNQTYIISLDYKFSAVVNI
ncbi:MAG: hypothetical protein M0Q54_00675 [Pigmentiphaga sp.]|nr:hypothetical protein [Pigmentiphaga sp.]